MAVIRRATASDATWARAWTADAISDLATLTGQVCHGDIAYVTATAGWYLWTDDDTWHVLPGLGAISSRGPASPLVIESEDAEIPMLFPVGGNIADGALSANVPLKNGTNAFTGANSFATNPLDLLVGQIKFPATQNPSADANTLDDYEEGAWTPSLNFTGGSVGITYGVNTGLYVKIGRYVALTGYMALTSKGSSTGGANIAGLPFPVGSTLGHIVGSKPSYNALAAGVAELGIQMAALGASTLSPTKIAAGVNTVMSDVDFTNTSGIIVYFCYLTD